MYVKDIVSKARKMNMLSLVNSETLSKTATYNTFASKMNSDKRFVRTAENTFGLTSFNSQHYDGHFRQMLSNLKKERRAIAAAGNEIQNKASSKPLVSIQGLPAPQGTCSTPHFGQHDVRIGRLEQIVEKRFGFEWRLKTTAALRGNDMQQCEHLLKELSHKIKQ